MKKENYRILARDCMVSNDTWKTGLNNNDLIIGPSGAGKTRGYVKPNLLQCEESVIVADTKGNLIREVGGDMACRGYKVINIDFTDMLRSYGYNPLDYIRRGADGRPNEQDVMSVAACLCPIEGNGEPFWDQSARMYLASMIGYVLECLPPEEQTLEYVFKLFAEMDRGVGRDGCLTVFDRLFLTLGQENPNSFAYQKYQLFQGNRKADRTNACIKAFVADKLEKFTFDGPMALCRQKKRVNFAALGREKTAVFLTVSDTDRSMDRLVNLFYTQALQSLCRSADRDYPDCRLPVPVRFILDDFATNTVIPGFDNLISVIRSREIYVSVIIQSLSQLEGLYGHARAMTIVNNCDHCLYLGGQDVETARYFSEKLNRTADKILDLPLGSAFLFTRGEKARQVEKFDLTAHKRYQSLPEAAAGKEAVPQWEALAG